MSTLQNVARVARDLISPVASRIVPVRWKEFNELQYWKAARRSSGVLSNSHYRFFYTTHFGLDDAFYAGKTILDIGCGPRGSLEWASMTGRRIGLDPLAKEYLRLGADQHQMEYMAAPSEAIPLPDGACDVVCAFNSLDHVEDLTRTLREIKRVIRPGGLFLLLVEVNHAPTACEPHRLTPHGILAALQPELRCEHLRAYRPTKEGLYHAIRHGVALPHPEEIADVAYLSGKFRREER